MRLIRGIILLSAMSLTVSSPVQAQEKKDNTGTNPISFTYDWRSYVEFITPNDGDNSTVVRTIEQRYPLGKYQFRFRVRHTAISLDPEGDGSSIETSGLGDWDARLLTVPIVNQKWALAFGLESIFDTATNVRLGAGKYSLGPQVFGVLFGPPGPGKLVAPAYQYVFSIAGDDDRADVRRSQFDLFYLILAKDKKWWSLINPQAVIDHENDASFALLEVEYGRMILGGMSSYVRPSFGLGDDKPYDWSAEFGFKAIWR